MAAIYPNPSAASNEKVRSLALKLAAHIACQLGIVRTWPNLQTIRLAIESEAAASGVPIDAAADVIVRAAREQTRLPQYTFAAEWVRRETYRENSVDRFWFEDARWRTKTAYLEFRADLRESRKPGAFCELPSASEVA